MAVWGRALTDSEITSLYNGGAGTPLGTGLVVRAISPEHGATLDTHPTNFTVRFSESYDAVTIQPGDLKVNSIPADSVALVDGTAITFRYNTSPVTLPGQQILSMTDGAVASTTAGPLKALDATFVYDPYANVPPPRLPPQGPSVLDTTFAAGGMARTSFSMGDANAFAVAIQADGKIVAGGGSSDGQFALARYETTGALDPSFGTGGKVSTDLGIGRITGLVIQADGRIVAAGTITGGSAIVRYSTSGELDSTFNSTGKVLTSALTANALALQADGKIVMVGSSGGDLAVVRLTTSGTFDTTFGSGGVITTDLGANDGATAVAIQGDGKIVVAGNRGMGYAGALFSVARYNPDGSLDTSFGRIGYVLTRVGGEGPDGDARAVILQPDGKIVIGGTASWTMIDSSGTTLDQSGMYSLVRYNPDGSLDSTFGIGGQAHAVQTYYGLAAGLARQADGKLVLAGGVAPTHAGYSAFRVVRFTDDGRLDTTFHPGDGFEDTTSVEGNGHAVVLQADGKIIVVGSSTGAFTVARYLPGETSAPVHLVVTQAPPASVTAGSPFGLAVEIENGSGTLDSAFNGTVTVALASNSGGATLGGTLSVTASGGVATFSGLTLTTAAAGYTLRVSGSGVTAATTSAMTVIPAAASQLVINQQPPASVTVGGGFGLQATIEDAYGNVRTDDGAVVTVALASNPGGATLGGTLSVAASQGVSTFSGLTLDHVGSGYTLQISGNGLTGATTGAFTVIPVPATILTIIQQPPASLTAGATFDLIARAEDDSGHFASTFAGTVTLALADNPGGATLGGTLTATASGGVATFSGLTLTTAASGYTLQVSSGGLKDATTGALTVTPAAAAQLVVTQPPPPTITAGTAFDLQATIEDAYGNVVTNDSDILTVALASNPTGAALGGTLSVTASQGVASFLGLTLTTAASGYALQVSIGPLAATTAALTVTPAAPARLVLADEPPGSLIAGAGFGLTVDVEDPYGNRTSFSGGVTVAVAIGLSDTYLGGPATATADGGVAMFAGLMLTRAGSYTLRVSSGDLAAVATNPIAVTPAAPGQLVVTTPPPGSATAGTGFGLDVSAEDPYGNPTPAFSDPVIVSIEAGPAGHSLGGTTTITASLGVAGFSGLTLDKAGTYALRASSGSLAAATTALTITPAAASRLLVIGGPPASLAAGDEFGFEVDTEDAYGNRATGFAGTVTVALHANPGNATLGGPVAMVASSGVAFFAGLALTRVGSGYTLQLTSGGLPAVTTGAFRVTPAAAARLVLTTGPPDHVIAGSPFGLTLTAEDRYGNVSTSFGGPVSVALANNPAQGVLRGSLSAVPSQGLVAFSGLTVETAAPGYTLTATGGGLSPATTRAIAVDPAAATRLVVSIPPPATVTAGTGFGLALRAEDPFGNLATGFTGELTIGLAKNPGQTTLNGPLTVAATAGVASVPALLSLDRAASGYALRATSDGLTPATTGDITIQPRPATHLVVLAQPPSLVTPGDPIGLTIAAEDAFGNIDTGFGGPISLAPAGGSGATLGGGNTVTARQGVAVFTGLTLSQPGTGISIQVASPGLAGTATTAVSVTAPAQLQFAVDSVTIDENVEAAMIQVVRAGGFPGAVSVTVATSGGSAVPGVNYTPVNQVLSFAVGQDSQTVTIPIRHDGVTTPDLTLTLVLSGPGAGAILGSPSTATLVLHDVDRHAPPAPLVTMDRVRLVTDKKRRVMGILVEFSGGLNSAQAQNPAVYRLAIAGKKGSFTARNTKVIPLRSAVYNATNHAVTFTPKKPFALKKPVQLRLSGSAPSGLTDDLGRLIDGNHDGQPGGDAVAVLGRTGAAIRTIVRGPLFVVRR